MLRAVPALLPFRVLLLLSVLGSGVLHTAYGQSRPPVQETGDTATADALRAEQLLVRGLTRAYVGDHAGALALYQQALRLLPQEAAVFAALAEAYAALGRPHEALYHATEAVRLAPQVAAYPAQLARLHLDQGDVAQALAVWTDWLRQAPDDPQALYQSARLLVRLGRLHEALTAYARLLARQPDPDVALLTEVLALYEQTGDAAGTLQVLHQLAVREPGQPQWLRRIGALQVQQQQWPEAAAAYEAALQHDPGAEETLLALASVYRQQGRPEAADALLREPATPAEIPMAHLLARATTLMARVPVDAEATTAAADLLQQALAREPSSAEARALLGTLYFHTGRYAEAVPLLYEAVRQHPREELRWQQAVEAAVHAGESLRAIEIADEGLLLFPGSVALLHRSGMVLLDRFQNEAARSRLEETLALLREEGLAQPLLEAEVRSGLALLAVRRRDEAAADSLYRQALRLAPDHAPALNNLAFLLAERNTRLPEALRLAERAAALAPDHPAFLDTVGWVYFRMNRLAEAQAWLDRALATGRAGGAAYEHYGDLLARQGRFAEARTYWQQALERMPDNRLLQNKLERPQQ